MNLAAVPLFVEFGDSKIEHFKQSVFAGKGTLFGNLTEAGINALNCVGGVHNLSDSAAVIKKLLDVINVAFPDINGSWVLRPFLA